jgi:hypothetical protein
MRRDSAYHLSRRPVPNDPAEAGAILFCPFFPNKVRKNPTKDSNPWVRMRRDSAYHLSRRPVPNDPAEAGAILFFADR